MVWRLNLRHFEVFRSIMMTGSTTKAATVLNISQPAVSRVIREFESRLGVELFFRRQGRLHPTPQGEWLFQQSEEMLSRFERLNNQIQDMHSMLRSEIKITATPPIAYGVLPDAIKNFRKIRPETSLSVQTFVRREIRNWMAEQMFDLSFAPFPLDYPPSEKETLTTIPAVCVLPHGHHLKNATHVTVSDLARDEWIMQVPESPFRLRLDQTFEQENIKKPFAIETQSANSVCTYVAAGLGVSVVDPFSAYRYRDMGLILKPFLPKLDLEYGVLYPIKKRRAAEAEVFIDMTKEAINSILSWYNNHVPAWDTQDIAAR